MREPAQQSQEFQAQVVEELRRMKEVLAATDEALERIARRLRKLTEERD